MSNRAHPTLPQDLESILSVHQDDHKALVEAFMPALCGHLRADRIFVQPRNPVSRVCKILRWRRTPDVPWPNFSGVATDQWFKEDQWEIEDPLFRAALQLNPSIYVEDVKQAADRGLLNLEFEAKHMFHTAFIHGHAHWPALDSAESADKQAKVGRQFYGSVQPSVFDGPRKWSDEDRYLVESCLVRIAPIMKSYGMSAPTIESLKK